MKQTTKGKRQTGGGALASEWVGGRLLPPFYITEDEPYRPELVLWLELPADLVVGHRLIGRGDPPVSFARTLLDTTSAPMVGPPRRPGRVRVADPELAAELREAVPGIEVVEAPTPELDRIIRLMSETMPGDDSEEPSYLEDGRVAPETVAALFKAAGRLFDLSPWKTVGDTQVLRVDIPDLGVEAACLSIIGELGESLGFILFPSLEAFEDFLAATERTPLSGDGPVDLGTSYLSLNFERGADLPANMRREAARHRWPVAGPEAYPRVEHRDRDGTPRPLQERDVRIVSACAASLSPFFLKHQQLFQQEEYEPVHESYFDGDDLEVRITCPYDDGTLFPVNARATSRPPETHRVKVARNAPCPCGSGRKYKRCCLERDQRESRDGAAPETFHQTDERLTMEILRFARKRFAQSFLQAERDFRDPRMALQLFGPWLVYHFLCEGKPLARWFVESEGSRLAGGDLEFLRSQQAAWLSVWEIVQVEPGSGLTVRDLLSGEERAVREVSGSRSLVRRDCVLGRVVDHAGGSVFCGMYPRSLPPAAAGQVLERIQASLRKRVPVPVERLRDEKLARRMIRAWEETVAEFDARLARPPSIRNTDGEELLLTVDHFDLDPLFGPQVESRLATLEGLEPTEDEGGKRSYIVTKPGNTLSPGLENTIVGRIEISEDKLRIETHSVERADSLRARVENACGEGGLRHRAREHSDPLSLIKPGGDRPRAGGEPPPPEEANRLVREFKERHYASWTDTPVPALGGKSPRNAVKTARGRNQVDLLLKDMENHEARLPAGERFDFSGLRRALGLPD